MEPRGRYAAHTKINIGRQEYTYLLATQPGWRSVPVDLGGKHAEKRRTKNELRGTALLAAKLERGSMTGGPLGRYNQTGRKGVKQN